MKALIFSSFLGAAIVLVALGQEFTIDGSVGDQLNVEATVIIAPDSDGDGLSDREEDADGDGDPSDVGVTETDPFNADTDGDGFSDKEELDADPPTNPLVHPLDAIIADPDWARVPDDDPQDRDRDHASLKAYWDFESISVNTEFENRKSASYHLAPYDGSTKSGTHIWLENEGNLGKSARIGVDQSLELTGGASIGPYTASNFIVGMSLKFDAEPTTNSALPIFGGFSNGLNDDSDDFVIELRVDASGDRFIEIRWKLLAGTKTVWEIPSTVDLTHWNDLVVGSSNEDNVEGNRICFVNGQKLTTSENTGHISASGSASNWGGRFGAHRLVNGGALQYSSEKFEIDRAFVGTVIAPPSAQQAFYDLITLIGSDVDADGLTDSNEASTGGNPFAYDGFSDPDLDGLTTANELNPSHGFGSTEPFDYDTDGDFFPDGWEVDNGYDPNNGTSPGYNADPDSDNLSNWEEFLLGTNPADDDSDDDGIKDGEENLAGYDPNDPLDQPLDPSDYHGPDLAGACTDIGELDVVIPGEDVGEGAHVLVTADTTETQPGQNPWPRAPWGLRIGSKKLKDVRNKVVRLSKNRVHEVEIFEYGETDPNEVYCFDVDLTVIEGFVLVCNDGSFDAPHPEVDGSYVPYVNKAQWEGKKAYLVPIGTTPPLSRSASFSQSSSDATGPRYRKVALNGRPLADEKPEQESETDEHDETTYVDAFDHSLHHDTSFVYVPLAGTDLALQASASVKETIFNDRSGLQVHEDLASPFGPCWSSNLCSYVEVIISVGEGVTDPVTVNVVDEGGRSQRFGTNDLEEFFAWPSARVDKKTYLNKLEKAGSKFVLRKKYGNTLVFEPCDAWFLYSTDRIDGSKMLKKHNYWRLTEVKDRYGNRMLYDYGAESVSLIPSKIWSPDRPGQKIDIQRNPDCRHIDSIVDPNGNVVTFNYGTTQLSYTLQSGEAVSRKKLDSVSFADGTSIKYFYDQVDDLEDLRKEPGDDPKFTKHFHTNIRKIEDKRGNSHDFAYAFNRETGSFSADVSESVGGGEVIPAVSNVETKLPGAELFCLHIYLDDINDGREPGAPEGSSNATVRTVYGLPRRVTSVRLPEDSSGNPIGVTTFSRTPQSRVVNGGNHPYEMVLGVPGGWTAPAPGGELEEFPPTTVAGGNVITSVEDAEGKITTYTFSGLTAEVVDVDITASSGSAGSSSFSKSEEWMVYYTQMEIEHTSLGIGETETFTFDLASGLSLASMTDLSGNTTSWEYGNGFVPTIPFANGPGSNGSQMMVKWSDPTMKEDALLRRETYEYSDSFRVMNKIVDVHGTITTYEVDAFGRRRSMVVHGSDGGLIRRERYDYSNPKFRGFMTRSTVEAYASVSNQDWERDLVTAYLPDNLGRVWKQIVDPEGEKLTTISNYDLNGNKTAVVDPRGYTTKFDFDAFNRPVLVTNPLAGTKSGERVTTKQILYDLNGNKAAEVDEEGIYTIYRHDELNRVIETIVDMEGDGVDLPQPNANGLLPDTEAGRGSSTAEDLVTQFQYNAVNSLTHSIDPEGNVTRTFYDAIRRPVQVFSGLTAADATDLASAIGAATGNSEKTRTEFRYTDDNLMLMGTEAVDGNPGSSAFNTEGFKPTEIIRYEAVLTATGIIDLHSFAQYDEVYRPLRTETEYEAGVFSRATMTYGSVNDPQFKELLESRSFDDRGKETLTIHDGLNRPLSVTDSVGVLDATTSTNYTSTGLAWRVTDPEGRKSETEYDGAGRPVIVWQPDPITGEVNRGGLSDPLIGSPRVQTIYDDNGNVVASINPLGYRWDYVFDARNRKTEERQPSVTGVEVDSAGQVAETRFQRPITQFEYDGVGNALVVTDPRGNFTRSFYDHAYRLTDSLSNPVTGAPSSDLGALGNHDIRTTTFYDRNGNVVKILDGNGNATRNTYDRLNRLETTTTNPTQSHPGSSHADDIVVTNTYDDSGNLVQVKDGKNQLTGFRYDGLGRKTRTLWDEGDQALEREEKFIFDDGVVQSYRIDPMGQKTQYLYDGLNRLEFVRYDPDNLGPEKANDRDYVYDLVGNILEVRCPKETLDGKITRECEQEFDNLNRVVEEVSAGRRHFYTYDKAGNRRTTTYNTSGRFLESRYDKLNRLVSCLEGSSSGVTVEAKTEYSYDLNGNVTRKVLPNGNESKCRFDKLNRTLFKKTLSSSGSIVSSFDYSLPHTAGEPSGYDDVGNVLRIEEDYGDPNVSDRSVVNVYDFTYRLSSETITEVGGDVHKQIFTYDKANNRTFRERQHNGNPFEGLQYSYGGPGSGSGRNSNQLWDVTDGITGNFVGFTYDANGNRIGKYWYDPSGLCERSHFYDYDYENRLIEVDDRCDQGITQMGLYRYDYDHRTRRVLRDESDPSVGGVKDEISFSSGLSVQEFAFAASTPTVEYVRGSDYGGGIGGVLYTVRSGQRSFNSYNSRGDVVSRTDENEAITWQASYEAFGTRNETEGNSDERQTANTKDEDAWGGLNEGMRYRDLEFGIFLTRDPAGFVDGPNVYTYVRQNPWSYYDPLGLYGGPMAMPSTEEMQEYYSSGQSEENIKFAAKLMGSVHASFIGGGAIVNFFRSGAWLTPAGAYTASETVTTGFEISAGYEGPPIIPGPGDAARVTIQSARKAATESAQATSRYSGDLIQVANPDDAADALAKKLGGKSRVRFANDEAGREFDAVSDEFIAQAKPGIQKTGKKFRSQAKATFEAAKETGRKVYYEFAEQPGEDVVKKLNQYSDDFEVEVVIDVAKKADD